MPANNKSLLKIKDSFEEKNLIIDPQQWFWEDVKKLKGAFFRKAKRESANFYDGKRFEYDCWEFFNSLSPTAFNHPFREFKFDLSESRNYQKGDLKRSYQSTKQTDLIFLYERHIFIIECKTTKQGLSSESLSKEIELFDILNHFKTQRVKKLFGEEYIPVFIFCTDGFSLDSEDQKAYLEDKQIILLDESRREYIEEVLDSSNSPEFALNQFLGFFRKNKPDFNRRQKDQGKTKKSKWEMDAYHSLSGKKKKHKVYTFSISPEDMLKVSTVAHQKINNIFEASDSVDKKYYQRLLTGKRLKDLGDHLNTKNTPFPNNILVSYRGKNLEFTSKQKRGTNVGNTPGKLRFDACPGTFHVIDGQHRLFGYTQVEKKPNGIRETHRMIVTCFDGLSVSEEAEIFLEVNQNAKPIAPQLLMEIEFASGAISKENICNGVTFKLRDADNSILKNSIKQAEGRGARTGQLNPKNFQTSLFNLEILNYSDLKKLFLWEEDMYKTIDTVYSILNSQIAIFHSENKDRWRDKKNNGSGPGVLQDIFISGLLGVFDRIIMEVFKTNPKMTSDGFISEVKELTKEFSINFKKELPHKKNKILNISEFFKLGGSSQPIVTAYLVDNYLSNRAALKRKGDEEKLYAFGTENLEPEQVAKIIRENDELKKELEEFSHDKLKSASRNQRAMAYHKILKDIIHLSLSKEEHYGVDYWAAFVIACHWKKGNVWDLVEDRWKKEQTEAGEYAYSHPIAHVEGELIRTLISIIPKHRRVILKTNKPLRIKTTIDFIWANLVIPPEGENFLDSVPEDNSPQWKNGTKYIEIFEKFRNYGVDDSELITTHGRPEGVEGNPTKPFEEEFDYYEKEFLKKLPDLIKSLDLKAAKKALR